MNKRKKLLIAALAILLVLAIGFATVWFLFLRAPKVESLYDRVVELVEASYEINTIFYGAGLPVHRVDSAYANFTHLYFGFDYAGSYEIVTENAEYIWTRANELLGWHAQYDIRDMVRDSWNFAKITLANEK